MMADEYHVTFRVDHPVEMKTLAQLAAEGWTKGERYRNEDYQVVDEHGKTAGKYFSWHRGKNEDLWVSEIAFEPDHHFHIK